MESINQFLTESKMSEIVKDPKWQRVRESLLGQWKTRPDWCCSQLRLYLGLVHSATDTQLRIVRNYLTGTGFRTGRIKHNCISKLRSDISKEWKLRKE